MSRSCEASTLSDVVLTDSQYSHQNERYVVLCLIKMFHWKYCPS